MKRLLSMALLVALSLCACKREQRSLRTDPPVAAALAQVAVMPGGINGTPPEVDRALGHPSQTNAYELSQGKRLYSVVQLRRLSRRRWRCVWARADGWMVALRSRSGLHLRLDS